MPGMTPNVAAMPNSGRALMHEDAERILAFQRAYDIAAKRLYSNEPLIDITRLPEKTEDTIPFQSGDRLLFFTRPECPACDVLMNQLLKKIDVVSGIDIYLRDIAPGDDAAVRAWASTHRIEPDWVRSRRITLNHDGGALDKLTHGQGDVPSVFRRRGEDRDTAAGSGSIDDGPVATLWVLADPADRPDPAPRELE